jgi:hypothetical protein
VDERESERKRMTSRYFKDMVQLHYLNNFDPK